MSMSLQVYLTCNRCKGSVMAAMPIAFTYADGCFQVLRACDEWPEGWVYTEFGHLCAACKDKPDDKNHGSPGGGSDQ